MKKKLLCIATTLSLFPVISHSASPYFSLKDGDGFKRFSVSVGALHVMPQGKAQPFKVNTTVAENTQSAVGNVKANSVLSAIDTSQPNATLQKGVLQGALLVDQAAFSLGANSGLVSYKDANNGDQYLKASVSGDAVVNGLSNWNNPGTGLEADDVTTLGIMTNYFFNDNISFEVKAGVPPKVDLKGKGTIYAPLTGSASPQGIGGLVGKLPLKKDIEITNLEANGTVASARAWTPAFEFQYHFGKTGVNKFRPYVGVGLMYAYFNDLKMNSAVKQDLINAGHMVANIKDGKAGAALDKVSSDTNPKIKLEASDAFAPVATAGFTYDFNDRWFAVGSVSYAHLTSDTTITISNEKHGKLIKAKADIEVNPILGYAGVGYRF
jgi:outer membrane protein W